MVVGAVDLGQLDWVPASPGELLEVNGATPVLVGVAEVRVRQSGESKNIKDSSINTFYRLLLPLCLVNTAVLVVIVFSEVLSLHQQTPSVGLHVRRLTGPATVQEA